MRSRQMQGMNLMPIKTADAVKEKYEATARIAMPALNETSEGLIRRIFASAVPVTVRYIRL